MTSSPKPQFFAAGISLLIAVATGASWVGAPFRWVELLTLLGLGMMTGVSWAQGVARLRERRRAGAEPAPRA